MYAGQRLIKSAAVFNSRQLHKRHAAQRVFSSDEAAAAANGRIRATGGVFGAMLMGITSQRYLLQMPDLVAADTEDIVRIIAPLLDQLFHPDSRQ